MSLEVHDLIIVGAGAHKDLMNLNISFLRCSLFFLIQEYILATHRLLKY